jgi:chromosome partitioning protein
MEIMQERIGATFQVGGIHQEQQPTPLKRTPARILAFVNQKGGTGKTTTAQNLAVCFGLYYGKRVLAVDLDPQGNFGQGLSFDPISTSKTADRLLVVPKVNIDEYIIPIRPGVDLIHNSFQKELREAVDRLPLYPGLLRKQLGPAINRYDYVIVDTPASLSRSTQFGVDAADQIILVVSCGIYGLKGMVTVIDWMSATCNRLSKPIPTVRVILNNYDERRRFDREFKQEIEHIFGHDLFRTQIRTSTRIVEAAANGIAVIEHNQPCSAASDFLQLSREILGLSSDRDLLNETLPEEATYGGILTA